MDRATTAPERGQDDSRAGGSARKLPVVSPRDVEEPADGAEVRLSEIGLREEVEFVRFDMSDEAAEPLLERGILPGCRLCPVRTSPSGDPVVLVDGTMLALRKETAGCLCVKRVQH